MGEKLSWMSNLSHGAEWSLLKTPDNASEVDMGHLCKALFWLQNYKQINACCFKLVLSFGGGLFHLWIYTHTIVYFCNSSFLYFPHFAWEIQSDHWTIFHFSITMDYLLTFWRKMWLTSMFNSRYGEFKLLMILLALRSIFCTLTFLGLQTACLFLLWAVSVKSTWLGRWIRWDHSCGFWFMFPNAKCHNHTVVIKYIVLVGINFSSFPSELWEI